MLYTTSIEADKKIKKDLDAIIKIIVKEFAPISVILFGGFGHGCGSFKKEGKKIVPLNDYDLYVITKKAISGKRLEEVGKRCSEGIGRGGLEIVENFNREYDKDKFFHVDLHCLEYKKLRKMYPTQRAYDLKTSIVIYGEGDVLKKIPEVNISTSDAIRLMFNKIDHFSIAENNSRIIKSIYAVKGFTDLCSALLILEGKYVSSYQEREKIFQGLNFPGELKKLVKKATKAKLYKGYEVKNVEDFFQKSKKWVGWTLKRILQRHLRIQDGGWKDICKKVYKKLPYIYFNDYLGTKYLFFGQYYLNIRFFIEAIKKGELLLRSIMRWRDVGLILGISLVLYFVGEKKESEKYLKKITSNTRDLKERILKLYSLYYLQKLV